jgi:hypothetical protein
MRFKGIIQKNAVVSFARLMLQGQCDQVAKSAERHEVLARKEPIICLEAQIRTTIHGGG